MMNVLRLSSPSRTSLIVILLTGPSGFVHLFVINPRFRQPVISDCNVTVVFVLIDHNHQTVIQHVKIFDSEEVWRNP